MGYRKYRHTRLCVDSKHGLRKRGRERGRGSIAFHWFTIYPFLHERTIPSACPLGRCLLSSKPRSYITHYNVVIISSGILEGNVCEIVVTRSSRRRWSPETAPDSDAILSKAHFNGGPLLGSLSPFAVGRSSKFLR